MTLGEGEIFFYPSDGVSSEDLRDYKPCGLHPIILGDILPKIGSCVSDDNKKPRYRIAQKLGTGAFSTVWLARDIQGEKYVALKACVGTEHPVQNNEVRILQWIHQHGCGKLGFENIVELHDAFTIRGPNGFHEIIITEVIVPMSGLNRLHDFEPDDAICQIISGLSFLHSERVAHGDPHNGNFGIAIPQLQQFDESTIADFFADPSIIPVVPKSYTFSRDSVPPYLTETVCIGSFLRSEKAFPTSKEMVFKLLDFGRAYFTSEKMQDLPGCVPALMRPPEVFMYHMFDGKAGSAWSLQADVWSLGCMLCKIKGIGLLTDWGDSKHQLYRALRYGGRPPAEWGTYWDPDEYHKGRPDLPSLDRTKAWEDYRKRLGPDGEKFFDMVMRMVVTDPEKRIQLDQLLRHPFYLEGSSTKN